MFSKKMVLIIGVIVLITINIIVLSATSKSFPALGIGHIAISFVAPFQELVTRSIRFVRGVWEHYFFLVAVSHENLHLKQSLNQAIEKNNQQHEAELANIRLRSLLSFQKTTTNLVLAAEVIGKDPSAWFKTIIIDKGRADGLKRGFPVVVAQGVTGQIIETSEHYSKVMLILDRNSAVDAVVQRSRARGIIKGTLADQCRFEYVLQKHDVRIGDNVVASGFDGVYPKGLRIGWVSDVIKGDAEIFQEITVTPYVDFEKLEEVLIVLNPQQHGFASKQ
jgi:rod shape-determining protein MreC